MIGYIMTDPNMIDPKMMSRKRFSRKKSSSYAGNDDKCCSEPSTECSGIDVKNSMPKIIPDAPIIEPIMKRAVKVHHYNADESDSPRDI
jgi:hypothetical protein